VNEFGKLNVLVNNAGIVALGQIGKFDMAKWQKVIDVNLTGTFLGMQASVAAMKAAGGGSIINVSSIEGMRGAVMVHPYVASKWAVRGLSKSAALELGPDQIRVNSIHLRVHPHPDDQALPRQHAHLPAGTARAVRGGVDVRRLPRQRRIALRHRRGVRDGRRTGQRRSTQALT
jgi:3alpha(or 20beta)-hydroxysteroid dehydrogenase